MILHWRDRAWLIGEYYARLTTHLLEGTALLENGSSNDGVPDARNIPLDADLEIKGGGNTNPWIPWEYQFLRHLRRRGVEGRGRCFFYVLYSYCNSRRGDRTWHVAQETPTTDRLKQFLARHTMICYLLDIRVLEAIRNMRHYPEGVNRNVVRMRKYSDGELRPYLHLSRRFLKKELAPGRRKVLSVFGANSPRHLRITHGRIATDFMGNQSTFPLVLVTTREMRGRVLPLFGSSLALSTDTPPSAPARDVGAPLYN